MRSSGSNDIKDNDIKDIERLIALVDRELLEDIEAELKAAKHSTQLSSVDGHTNLDAREIKKAIIYYDAYKNDNKKITCLERACDKGNYLALNKRCDLNILIIKDDNINEIDKAKAKDTLQNDIAMLSNLYWSVGCMDACQFLFQIGDYYYDKYMKTGDDSYWQDVTAFWKQAATYYLHSKTLYKYQESLDLNALLYNKERLNDAGFEDVKQADITILGMFSDKDRRDLEVKEIEWEHQVVRKAHA